MFIGYHSTKDDGVPIEHNSNLYENYNQLGFDATLYIVKDKNDEDGRIT
ncbi:DUF2920 family protein [Campylobacter lari]|nr:DUF2920 family protein [Campylobacter lari]MCR2078022.1 DUF2920 family protein [Campylobacter lari subsp. concheus]MCR2087301.1 DUF2920 family protein [Campylobacter lari subsp. concheus]